MGSSAPPARGAARQVGDIEAVTTKAELKRTALHEAAHAVLHIVFGLGCQKVTIVPDYSDGTYGAATHGGAWGKQAAGPGEQDDDTATLRMLAPEEFWLRHAVACYAGAEAVRRAGYPRWKEGADSDYRGAIDVLSRITSDNRSIDLLTVAAKRRCLLLVKYYWPEIQAVAERLVSARTIKGKTAHRIWLESITARRALIRTW